MRFNNSKKILSSEKGFILLTAIIASVILLALTMLIVNVTNVDLTISSKSVGHKKAMSAAEAGIHSMMQNFDPLNITSSAVTNIQVDASNDPGTVYTVSTPSIPTISPTFLPMSGYSIGGGQQWGQRVYNVNVTGRNTKYKTVVTIGTGIGYGPVESSTMMR